MMNDKCQMRVASGGGRARARAGGQILIIVLVAIAVLVGLIFYVYNAGAQINRRVGMQHAADAAAIGGGTFMARCMNVVAMNNVAQARLIALIAVLDALPLAAEMTIAEEEGQYRLPEALEKWKNSSGRFTAYEEDNFYQRGLADLYAQMNRTAGGDDTSDLDLLRDTDAKFDHRDERQLEGGFDVERATQWNSGSGSTPTGTIWQAIVALDEFSQAIVETAGILTQSNAVWYGERNRADSALLVPVLPEMPARRTHWRDFGVVLMDSVRYGWENHNDPARKRWVHEVVPSNLVSNLENSEDVPWDCRRFGVRGGAIPDFAYPHRLGPFARVWRWRSGWDEWTGGYIRTYVGRWGYTTWGPLENALQTVLNRFGQSGGSMGAVDTSRFAFHLRSLAKVKLAYMFGLSFPQNVQDADQWILDYADAKAYVEEHKDDKPPPVMVTRWYTVGVKATVRWSNSWMKTWDPTAPTPTFTPKRYWSWQLKTPDDNDVYNPALITRWISDGAGWQDVPNNWEKLSDYVWYRKSGPSEVEWDHQLQLPPRFKLDSAGELVLDDDGEPIPIPYKIWSVSWRTFGGIELRNEIELSSPIDGATQGELPRPILIDTSNERGETITVEYAGERRDAVRIEPFRYLGVAMKHDVPPVWRQRFSGANPIDGMATIAQAKVFNNASWDLWTQDWQAQLMPVTDWSDWVDKIRSGIADAPDTENMVDPDLLQTIHEYLTNLGEDLAEEHLTH